MKWYDVNLRLSSYYSGYKFNMLKDLQELYKKYLAGELGGTQQQPPQQPECKSTFCDNFESNWFSLSTYISQFGETLEQEWFADNNYISEYEDNFDAQWFVDNNYLFQLHEDFEGADWDE